MLKKSEDYVNTIYTSNLKTNERDGIQRVDRRELCKTISKKISEIFRQYYKMLVESAIDHKISLRATRKH